MVALKIFIIMTIIGGLSSGLGGLISCIFKTDNKKVIASLYEFTAGIMTAIVCFDMLPECFKIAGSYITLLGVFVGISIVVIIDKFSSKLQNKKYSKVSYIIIIAMALHNFIEGIAIGSSYMHSFSLGTAILISMILHDIPEGMVVGITSITEIKNFKKTIYNSIIAGSFTGFGTLIGYIIGGVNDTYIALCLAIAAGTMLYIVSCDLIPSSKQITKSKKVYIIYIMGILIGAIIT